MWILRCKNALPKSFVLSLNKILGLHSEKVVFICNLDNLFIAFTPCSFVSDECQVWVSVLAVFTNDFGVVILVIDEEVLWVVVDVHIDLGQCVVQRWVLNTLVHS